MNRDASPAPTAEAVAQAQRFREVFGQLKAEIHKIFVGHDELVSDLLGAVFAAGHVLLEGVPGVGKTLLARTLASALRLTFSRIQFTPDLLPADIVGTMALHEKPGGGHELRFEEGPIVANFVLADEINRATPKTQSALLEAMQERQVTVARKTMPLPNPFIVVATQNPIEQEGTYPLPEAQLDRFQVKLLTGYPQEHEYHEILERTTGTELPTVAPVATAEEVLALRRTVRSLVASQQVRALCGGRHAPSCQDVRDVALPVLRHRILLNFEGQAERRGTDDLVRDVIQTIGELSGS